MNNIEKIINIKQEMGENIIDVIPLPQQKIFIIKTSENTGIVDYYMGTSDSDKTTFLASIPIELAEEVDREIKKEKIAKGIKKIENKINKYKHFFKEQLTKKIMQYQDNYNTNERKAKIQQLLQQTINEKIKKKVTKMEKLITNI